MTIDEDDGYLPVDVKKKDGTTTPPVLIDIFEATNAYAHIHANFADLVDRGNAWVEWLVGKGLPPLSHGAAFGLVADMNERMADYAKKKPGIVSETVGSNDSTASPSSE